jgi:hypothetical protein
MDASKENLKTLGSTNQLLVDVQDTRTNEVSRCKSVRHQFLILNPLLFEDFFTPFDVFVKQEGKIPCHKS